MFEKIREFFKGVRYRVFPISTLEEALGVKIAYSPEMQAAVELWNNMFSGAAPWVSGRGAPAKDYGAAASIAAELARLATVESQLEITGGARAKFLTEQMQPVLEELRQNTEFGVESGSLIFKPYIDGGKIVVDYCRGGEFYPIAFDGARRLTAVAFVERKTEGDKLFRRVEYHHLEDGGCVIENLAFESTTAAGDSAIGRPMPLAEVDEWASLEPQITIENVDQLLIGYFRMPLANHIDKHSPLGVSAYSRAVDAIRNADEQWGRILWEYEGTELAVHSDETLFMPKIDDEGAVVGRKLPKGKERLYRLIPGLEYKMDVFSPAIRDTPLFSGMNNILKRIEFQVGLAYGTLSDPQNVDKTAEEIKASKQRSYATVADIQKALKTALDGLLYAMDIWATVGGLAPAGSYKARYSWDDSIINDPSAKKQLYWSYVQAGKFPAWKYFSEFEGYTEEEAKALVSEAAAGMGDPYALA